MVEVAKFEAAASGKRQTILNRMPLHVSVSCSDAVLWIVLHV